MLLPNIKFELPAELEATAPIEARGLPRDAVRLLVSHYETDAMAHTQFFNLVDHLNEGDVLIINTSATLPAAVRGLYRNPHANGETEIELHFSTQQSAEIHVIELRTVTPDGTKPFYYADAGDTVQLPNNVTLELIEPYQGNVQSGGRVRLWLARLSVAESFHDWLNRVGFPIRYSYVPEQWSLESYQTVFANEPGSAEMPSAGRAFSPLLITQLVAKGVQFAPIVLHTGVASLEDHELPYAEYFRVSAHSAETINRALDAGKRIIAIGTTAVRAVESVVGDDRFVTAGEGWTERIISAETPPQVVDGLLTGFHEPEATHLAMLTAIAGEPHLRITYNAALAERYLWHEFGDLHLIVP